MISTCKHIHRMPQLNINNMLSTARQILVKFSTLAEHPLYTRALASLANNQYPAAENALLELRTLALEHKQ